MSNIKADSLEEETRLEVAKFIIKATNKTSLIQEVSHKLEFTDFVNLAREEFNSGYKKVTPREPVILVAQFLANLNPSYRNADGEYVPLNYIRGNFHLTKEDVIYVIGKFEEVVKPFISVSTETSINGLKLKVATKMSKKALIKAAFLHLITGSEIISDLYQFQKVMEASVMSGNFKASYATLVGTAAGLSYDTVEEMMSDLALIYIDQTENVKRNGTLVFYNGVTRVEKI